MSSDEYSPTIRPPTSSCRAILTVCATDGSHSTTSSLQWLDRPVEKIFQLVGNSYGNRAQFALRYGLSNKSLNCVVLGLATLDHLKNSLQAVEMGPLPDDLLIKIFELQNSNFI